MLHCLRAATRILALQFCQGSIFSLALEKTLGRKQEGTAYLRQGAGTKSIKAHKKLCIQHQLTSEDWEGTMRGGIFDVPFVLNHGSPCLQVSKGILDQWINMCENMGSKEHKLNSGKGKTCCVFTDCESEQGGMWKRGRS